MRHEPHWRNRQSWNDEPGSDPRVRQEYLVEILRHDIEPLADRSSLDTLVEDGMPADLADHFSARAQAWLKAHPEAK